jgi:hypothetical protein
VDASNRHAASQPLPRGDRVVVFPWPARIPVLTALARTDFRLYLPTDSVFVILVNAARRAD